MQHIARQHVVHIGCLTGHLGRQVEPLYRLTDDLVGVGLLRLAAPLGGCVKSISPATVQ
jgi:hypothetical protein